MKLTTEEKAKLKSNIEKIKAYIEAEISPKLCGEAITVYFGNVVHFANGTTGKQYRLYVDGRSVCGGAGNLLMNLLPTGTQKFDCSDFCTRSDAGLELIHSWLLSSRNCFKRCRMLRSAKAALTILNFQREDMQC